MAKKIQHLEKIDIIIPSYNRKAFLKKAVRSVYRQTYQNWNLIIIDDGSTDGTHLEDYGPKSQLFRLEKNRGVSFARNFGIKNSSSNGIAFLDSDDEWLSHKLEKQVECLQKKPEAAWIHCDELWLKNNRVFNQKKKHQKPSGRIFSDCVLLCCVSPSAVLIKRDLFNKLGLFREDFPVCEDYELWLRLSASYEIEFIKESLVIKQGGHRDQLSNKYKAMDYWRVKALFPFLKDVRLSSEEKKHVKQVLSKKIEILLSGYRKYNNFKNYEEIEALQKFI